MKENYFTRERSSDFLRLQLSLIFFMLCFSPLQSQGALSFVNYTTYEVGLNPAKVLIEDFNSDNKPDMAVVNFPNHSISILFGNGDGSFQPAADYYAGLSPWGITTGDFNNDGMLDIATSNGDDTFSIIIGNGDGTFMPGYSGGTTGRSPRSVATAEFNGDGNLDIVTANHYTGRNSPSLSLFLGNGDGTFTVSSIPHLKAMPTTVKTADFNNDGKADLAVSYPWGSEVGILISNGDGTFQPLLSARVPVHDRFNDGFSIDDFNSDGNLDVIAIAYNGFAVTALGNGDGTFQRLIWNNPNKGRPQTIFSSDLNCDGMSDLATITVSAVVGSESLLSTYPGIGDGTFLPNIDYIEPVVLNYRSVFASIASGDFDGDGKEDLLVKSTKNNKINIYLNTGSGCGPTSPSDLITIINDMLTNGSISGPGAHGVGNALIAKLEAAQAALNQDPPDYALAISDLNAFINQVSAQSGKKINADAAAELIGHAEALIDQYSALL